MTGPNTNVEKQPNLSNLADQLSEGFSVLLHEYCVLREQQQQLEDQLEYAKKQVRMINFLLSFMMNIHLALDL
jgi:hypothetical protein